MQEPEPPFPYEEVVVGEIVAVVVVVEGSRVFVVVVGAEVGVPDAVSVVLIGPAEVLVKALLVDTVELPELLESPPLLPPLHALVGIQLPPASALGASEADHFA